MSKNSDTTEDKNRFPVEARILNKTEFQNIYSTGTRYFSKNFVLVCKDGASDQSRLGITVTKKISKRANKRNTLKRRIREIFRLNRHRLSGVMDIIVIARHGSLDCDYEEVSRQILGCLKYNKLLKATPNKTTSE